MNKHQIQQGDCIFQKVEFLPAIAKRVNDPVLAYGEATGFAHKVTTPGTQIWEFGGEKFLVVPKGEKGVIKHSNQEGKGDHGIITLEPGIHKFSKILEYDHFVEEAKEVQD